MAEKTDVLVIGAGPAGSTAARYAAKAGASVMLAEKRRVIGVPVQCGEFIPALSELRAMFPRAPALDELFSMNEGLAVARTTEVRMYSPKGKEYPIPFEGFTVNRDRHDQRLAALAQEAGATVRTNCSFTGFCGKTAQTSQGDIIAKVVIAADGPVSRAARSAGFAPNRHLCPALTCQASGGIEDGIVKMYFGKSIAPGGYAWIIPKGRAANVGLGAQSAGFPLRRRMAQFLSQNGLEAPKMTAGWVPMGGPLKSTVVGNLIAVGDAAGHVMAASGGGIPVAVICGRIAGQAATRKALENRSLADYERKWRATVGPELATSLRTKRLADLAFRADFLLEAAMKRLGSKGLARAIMCRKTLGGV